MEEIERRLGTTGISITSTIFEYQLGEEVVRIVFMLRPVHTVSLVGGECTAIKIVANKIDLDSAKPLVPGMEPSAIRDVLGEPIASSDLTSDYAFDKQQLRVNYDDGHRARFFTMTSNITSDYDFDKQQLRAGFDDSHRARFSHRQYGVLSSSTDEIQIGHLY